MSTFADIRTQRVNQCLFDLVHLRQSGYDNDGQDHIREMLRVLLRKLDKAAADDGDVTGVSERGGYNVSQIPHKNDNDNPYNIVMNHVRRLLISYLRKLCK